MTMAVAEFTEEGTSRTVEAMGTTIHYHEVGEGPPALFLHSYGLGTTAWITWYKVLPEFAKHFRCIAMDLPNFAKTGPVMYDAPIHTFHLGLWFNSPADAVKAGCPGATTPFNGDHDAGVQVLNTAGFPDLAGPLGRLKP